MRQGLGVLFLAVLTSIARAQAVGPEFQVNTYTTGTQYGPAVASDADGGFVVVWSSGNQDGSSYGIFGQRYDASGAAQGSEFQVNTYTTSYQYQVSVASDADGDFVVVWVSGSQDGSSFGIFGRLYDASGTPLGSEFQVNTYTNDRQFYPSVASDADGDFVVVWQSRNQDGSYNGIFGQRYNALGTPQGSEFQVNTYTTGSQSNPSVASDADGDFVVVWNSAGQDGDVVGIFGRRYNASGTPQGSEFQVNTYTTGRQFYPSVASDASGDFVVVWDSLNQDGSSWGIFGQRYDASATPLGSEFRVNTYTTGAQIWASVGSDAAGDFVVVWNSMNQDGASFGVFGQRYDASGTPQGSEFQVNTYTTGSQFRAAVASDPGGEIVVVWGSQPQDGSAFGVFGQRFAGLDLALTVAIDIKPGGVPNSINPRSKGRIPVAVLTTPTFDATTVDVGSLRFGAIGTEAAVLHSAEQDVDFDGDTDLILHFRTQDTGIECGAASASLTGQADGQAIEGSDSIVTVGCS